MAGEQDTSTTDNANTGQSGKGQGQQGQGTEGSSGTTGRRRNDDDSGSGQSGTPAAPETDDAQDTETVFETYDDWYGSAPDAVKGLVDEHVGGLKSALDAERDERKKLSKKLKELGQQAEEGSELRGQIDTITGQLDEATEMADFYEEAHDAGIRNLRLAWLAYQKDRDGLQDRRGNVDFEKFEEVYPELFARQQQPPPQGSIPRHDTGAGTNAGNDRRSTRQPLDMNTRIRRAAGR